MLGLSALSFSFMIDQKPVFSSISFVCALMFKQMSLFYALPVFFYLLGECISKGLSSGYIYLYNDRFIRLIRIGSAVILTFAVILAPFSTSIKTFQQIFIRIFPVQRGLYEDKVANVWCALSVVLKLREMFSLQSLINIRS
jgi:alpha-1,3-glucosyltransferase